MLSWLKRRSRKSRFAGVAVVAALAALAPSAFGSNSGSGDGGATWNSDSPASSISATVYVSAVDCSNVAAGTYAGQESGIELIGSYDSGGGTVNPADFAGVYTYCHGTTQLYAPEFVTADPNGGLYTFTPGGFPVVPGDPLELSITSSSSGVKLTITDYNTGATKTITEPDIGPSAGSSAGTLPIFGDIAGAPYLSGSTEIVQQYTTTGGPTDITGPVPFIPVVFDTLLIDGQAPGNGFYTSPWDDPSGTPTATVTTLADGNFITALVEIKKPILGQTEDVEPVKGVIRIRLPGTHKFISLSGVTQIPNGSEIDADHGYVQITLELKHHKSETGIFYDGQFILHQTKGGEATATVSGGDSAGCTDVTGHTASVDGPTAQAASGKSPNKKKKVNSLWSNAHGNFTTKGSAGSAAVLGTRWYTENTCGGTYFYVARDKIKVTADFPYKHTVIVTKGHSYFAPDKWDDGVCGDPVKEPCVILIPGPKLARAAALSWTNGLPFARPRSNLRS
jgi:hypothetical protein